MSEKIIDFKTRKEQKDKELVNEIPEEETKGRLTLVKISKKDGRLIKTNIHTGELESSQIKVGELANFKGQRLPKIKEIRKKEGKYIIQTEIGTKYEFDPSMSSFDE